MPNVDRTGMIELLDRLGSESDETVLQAARELNRKLGEAGLTWDDLLRLDTESASDATHAPLDETPDTTAAADGDASPPNNVEAARLIERLLAREAISDTLRDDLTELKGALADGSFDAMDASYIRALAKRLGV
jgi:hypothetical protein